MDRKKQNTKMPSNKNRKNQNVKITNIENKRMEHIKKNSSQSYPRVPTYNRTYNNRTNRTNRTSYNQYSNQNRYKTSNNRNNSYNINYYNQDNVYSREPIQNKKIYRAKKKAKPRRIHTLSKVFTILMFTVIISYFGVSIFKSLNKNPISYETIEYGTIDDTTQAKGIIIRDEVVYKATKNGVLTFNNSENERVKKGETIAVVKNEEAIKTTEEDLNVINEKILQLQQQRDELSIFYEDVKKIDTQMQNYLDNSINELSIYNVSEIYEIKDYVNKKITIRNQMLLSENTGSVQELSSEKSNMEIEINANTENIIANESGILSYYTDGLEEVFSFETKDSLTKEQTLMKSENEQQYKLNILEGESVFKIVKNNTFYIATYIKNQSVSSWQQGETRYIYVNDNGKLKQLEVIIEKIDVGEKESYILMKSNKNMIDFIEKRNITFEISKPKEGFKILLNAVSEEQLLKVPTSYIVDTNVNKKTQTGEVISVPIKISGQDDSGEYTYVAISPGIIDAGDYIIDTQTNQEYQLNEIFTKKGIYIVNSGIYTFKNINTENSVQNDQFIILDPNKNTNIKLYDRYAPDLSVVKGEEIVNK